MRPRVNSRCAKVKNANTTAIIPDSFTAKRSNKSPELEMLNMEEDLLSNDPYQNLGNAIIARAYKDYILVEFASYRMIITCNGSIVSSQHNLNDPSINKNEIEQFFESGLYSTITNIPGDAILKLANNEIEMLKEAFRNGYVWEQFKAYNYGNMYSVDKYDYKKVHDNIREKLALESKVRKYESKIWAPYDALYKRVYRVFRKSLPEDRRSAEGTVCILVKDHMNFYMYDESKNDYVKVFNGNKVFEFGKGQTYRSTAYYKRLKKK